MRLRFFSCALGLGLSCAPVVVRLANVAVILFLNSFFFAPVLLTCCPQVGILVLGAMVC